MTKEMISTEQKQQIADDLRQYIAQRAGGSANKASKMLSGVSNAYLSLMMSGKWTDISDDAWRNVAKQMINQSAEWQIVDTQATQLLTHLFMDAKNHANTFGITAEAGSGKSLTCSQIEEVDNVFVVSCAEFFNRKTFLAELLTKMGKDSGGFTVNEMMVKIISHVNKVDRPLIILDEADKLTDQVFYFFITLYNQLEGKCGIVLLATDYLEKRVIRGLRLNKKGYKEIFSRLGRKFIEIPKASKKDITQLLQANGVSDPLEISRIINESEGDLRRVKRLAHAFIQRERKEAAHV
jgi:hypothetical protein